MAFVSHGGYLYISRNDAFYKTKNVYAHYAPLFTKP